MTKVYARIDEISRHITVIYLDYGLLPVRIEVAEDVAAEIYHFRPHALDGLNVVIDPDLLPGRTLAFYETKAEATSCEP